MSEQAEVIIRKMNLDDYNFVISSWLKSYYHSSYFTKRIRSSVFFKYHHQVATKILERPSTTVLIAADKVDPSVILGYMIYEPYDGTYVVHYTYVKSSFRLMGVGSELLKASELNINSCLFSHWSEPVDELIKKFTGMTYCPYLI